MSISQATHSAPTPLRRHTQTIRVGAGGYATIADAIAYINSLVTLNTQNRVRMLVDNDTYDEAFSLPQYADFEGETKAGVIIRHQEGGAFITVSDDSDTNSGVMSIHTDSLAKNFTVSAVEAIIAPNNFTGIILEKGETLVSGLLHNANIDCDGTYRAIQSSVINFSVNDFVSHYLSLRVTNSDFVSGANNCVGTSGYVGLLDFTDCNITGGEQMQSASPWNPADVQTEFWAVFFGLTFARTAHQIRPEINFTRCNVKQYDDKNISSTGMQAFNIEEYRNMGGYTNSIDSNFEVVRWDVDYIASSTVPLFIPGADTNAIKENPNATFGGFFDGCSFTSNSNYTPVADIRWQSHATVSIPPTITWGGTGTNPTLGDF